MEQPYDEYREPFSTHIVRELLRYELAAELAFRRLVLSPTGTRADKEDIEIILEIENSTMKVDCQGIPQSKNALHSKLKTFWTRIRHTFGKVVKKRSSKAKAQTAVPWHGFRPKEAYEVLDYGVEWHARFIQCNRAAFAKHTFATTAYHPGSFL
ncbi:hypothetical protein BABINDRAFT_162289 [Babjeviella inositovora NRRL Y-12698]|uniref:Uncharacterized protein n=1 Tax=Babjeviella inositovora NRRL Y-12698 TaxID=984486 RepID=A0A1E3QP76_9ASCO|nr:uncharacterized protein BABINDRAFT_162289 [Babjeviella inositovora NRRL Y-12698]ODQ79254.1 hypothetical protein BABINDRAFT_162289 [Babjeviella inositovora NRRL Y-12698]